MKQATGAYVLITVLAMIGACQASPVRELQHDLGIDDSSWKVAKETDTEIRWTTAGHEAVVLTKHPGASEVVDPNNQKALRPSSE
jgi:hypothetical protein